MSDNYVFELMSRDPGLLRESACGALFVADALTATRLALRERVPLPGDRRAEDVALVRAESYHRGMALELAAKAVVAEKTERDPPHHHRTEDLCRDAGIELSEDELELVRRLTEAVRWWGRYGAPKKAADFERAAQEGLKRIAPGDRQMLDGLLTRLGCGELSPYG